LSGLSDWICCEITSSSCFSAIRRLTQVPSEPPALDGNCIRTVLDSRMQQSTVLLPLYAHAPRVFPVSRMGLVHLMQRAEPQSTCHIRNVLAQRPPDALRASDPTLAPSSWALSVDVDRVYARPSASQSHNSTSSLRSSEARRSGQNHIISENVMHPSVRNITEAHTFCTV